MSRPLGRALTYMSRPLGCALTYMSRREVARLGRHVGGPGVGPGFRCLSSFGRRRARTLNKGLFLKLLTPYGRVEISALGLDGTNITSSLQTYLRSSTNITSSLQIYLRSSTRHRRCRLRFDRTPNKSLPHFYNLHHLWFKMFALLSFLILWKRMVDWLVRGVMHFGSKPKYGRTVTGHTYAKDTL